MSSKAKGKKGTPTSVTVVPGEPSIDRKLTRTSSVTQMDVVNEGFKRVLNREKREKEEKEAKAKKKKEEKEAKEKAFADFYKLRSRTMVQQTAKKIENSNDSEETRPGEGETVFWEFPVKGGKKKTRRKTITKRKRRKTHRKLKKH